MHGTLFGKYWKESSPLIWQAKNIKNYDLLPETFFNMTNKYRKSTTKSLDFFRIEKIENIESYFVSADEKFAEFTTLDEALDFLIIQIEDLKYDDFHYLSNEFERIFGEKPTDPDELSEYYNSSSASVILNVVSSNEVVVGVNVQLDIESKALNLSSLNIELGAAYEGKLSPWLERVKKIVE